MVLFPGGRESSLYGEGNGIVNGAEIMINNLQWVERDRHHRADGVSDEPLKVFSDNGGKGLELFIYLFYFIAGLKQLKADVCVIMIV